MNPKRFLIAFIAAFVFIFFFGFVWHGHLMQSAYMEIETHWRAEADFKSHFPALILGHAVMAFFLTWIYAGFAPAAGAGTGARLGVLIAFIFVGLYFIRFAVEPLTTKILVLGSIGDVLEFAIAGAIVGALYKPSATTTT